MIAIRRLESGYWHLRGTGPCEWAQPPHWPCDEETLRQHVFPEASESFVRACLAAAELARVEARFMNDYTTVRT